MRIKFSFVTGFDLATFFTNISGFKAGSVHSIPTPDNIIAADLYDDATGADETNVKTEGATEGLTFLATVVGTFVIRTASEVVETELDFGTQGTRSKTFTIVDANVTATSRIQMWQSGKAATGRSQDENEIDEIEFVLVPGAGSFTVYAISRTPISGLFKVNYRKS